MWPHIYGEHVIHRYKRCWPSAGCPSIAGDGEKTRIMDITNGFELLGYRIRREKGSPRTSPTPDGNTRSFERHRANAHPDLPATLHKNVGMAAQESCRSVKDQRSLQETAVCPTSTIIFIKY